MEIADIAFNHNFFIFEPEKFYTERIYKEFSDVIAFVKASNKEIYTPYIDHEYNPYLYTAPDKVIDLVFYLNNYNKIVVDLVANYNRNDQQLLIHFIDGKFYFERNQEAECNIIDCNHSKFFRNVLYSFHNAINEFLYDVLHSEQESTPFTKDVSINIYPRGILRSCNGTNSMMHISQLTYTQEPKNKLFITAVIDEIGKLIIEL